MSILRVQVTLNRDNGIPEDRIVNVWHFDSDQTTSDDADDVAGRVQAFYKTSALGTFPWWAQSLAGTGTIKVYDLADVPDRPVRHEQSFTFNTGTSSLPAELAVCLSMNGNLAGIPERVAGGFGGPAGDTKPRARRRGRIYLGPFSAQSTEGTGGGASDVMVNPDLVTAIKNAAIALAHGPDAGDGRLCVFSPTIAGPLGEGEAWSSTDLDAASSDVVGGFVDNAWDIQRRRGIKASTRTLWTV